MAALDDLLARIEDEALRNALLRELAPLRGDRELGLVFERHLPEKVRLPGLPIRRGSTVEVRAEQPAPAWQVTRVTDGKAELRRRGDDGTTITESHPVHELVVVREFGQAIYPGLKSVGRIERGGDKPFHTVINAENYHALETLLYTCEGQVDAIYIDPPYNTGAKDWKYNNDYVDSNDGYRHSKWLSFMEKRLLLAKRLLNPDNSVLIVTIDEKEYLRLGLLLQQLFPNSDIQMASVVINPSGSVRPGRLTRTDEFAFFVFVGSATLSAQYVPGAGKSSTGPLPKVWETAIRSGSGTGVRPSRPNLFYPVFITVEASAFHSVGTPLRLEQNKDEIECPANTVAIWPIGRADREQTWAVSDDKMRQAFISGTARIANGKRGRSVLYMQAGVLERIANGMYKVTGKNPDGSLQLAWGDAVSGRPEYPRTTWNMASHSASSGGTRLLTELIGSRSFPYPKSLYALEDTLRYVIGTKPDALVVDFFGGSGTTAHAVMRLNRQDGGRRRSIIVTNNEIGPEAERRLTEAGKAPGDPEWEALGIFEYITKPRLEAAVTGKAPAGKAVSGSYRFTDEFPMSEGFNENIEFFKLSYEDADRMRLGASFAAVAPLLWLMAGALGPRVDTAVDGWALPAGGRYGVLFDADDWPGFVEAVKAAEGVTHAFVVTDSDAVFQRVVAELPDTVTPVRLYESYLRSFAINTGVSA